MSHFLVNLSTTNIDKVVSMLFLNTDEHALTQLSCWSYYQRWNNNESSTLNQRNSIKVVSTMFWQRWNNVDKQMSAQLSFATKYQRWNNVDERWRSTFFQRWFNVDVFAGYWKIINRFLNKKKHLMIPLLLVKIISNFSEKVNLFNYFFCFSAQPPGK